MTANTTKPGALALTYLKDHADAIRSEGWTAEECDAAADDLRALLARCEELEEYKRAIGHAIRSGTIGNTLADTEAHLAEAVSKCNRNLEKLLQADARCERLEAALRGLLEVAHDPGPGVGVACERIAEARAALADSPEGE